MDGVSRAVLVDGVSSVVQVDGVSRAVLVDGVSSVVQVDGVSRAVLVDGVSSVVQVDGVGSVVVVDGVGSVVAVDGVSRAVLVDGVGSVAAVDGVGSVAAVDGVGSVVAVDGTRSPRHSQSQQSGLADQAAKLPFASAESLETMSEAEVPIGFTRSNRFRQSLPLSRSTSQTKLRSPGVLFLQFGDETRRVHVTHEIGSLDTLHALIVHMFPQKLTMGMLKSPNTAILIKDETRNVFYELEDVRDIKERSIIKIFRKDPVYAPYPSHASHIANGDLRGPGADVITEEQQAFGCGNTLHSPCLVLFMGTLLRPRGRPMWRERMEAMEKQIASLTGLVQNALLRGNEGEPASDKSESINGSSGTGTVSPSVRSTVTSSAAASTSISHPTAITRLQMQLHLHDLQQNAGDLRNQLQQLRKLQVQSQDTMKNMMKRLESEISIRVTETLRKQEDPLHRQRALVEEERQKYLNDEEMIVQQLNLCSYILNMKLEGFLMQTEGDHSNETLGKIPAQFPSLQSKMRVILRVEVEAVKFLKEEPHRLDILLKRCKTVTDALATLKSCSPSNSAYSTDTCQKRFSRPTSETLMKGIEEVTAQLPKHSSTESYSRNSEFEIPTSPPLNFQEQHTAGVKIWQNHNPTVAQLTQNSPAHAAPFQNPSGMGQGVITHNSLEEAPVAPSKRNMDQTISVEAAERDWEEKRASLTQFSNKDINRLLEETQVELMKAIPDLGFANKPKTVAMPTAESKQAKPQHAQKTVAKMDPNGRRHSEELTVHRYRTEKPSKSPPPPPPRRSFPSSHGLTTGRTGEVIVTNKKESTLKKADSDEADGPRPHVKLRRTMSEAKPPSTPPPIVASAVRDDEDEEDRIMAELEVFQRSSVPFTGSNDQGMAAFPTPDPRPCRVSLPSTGLKEIDVPCSPSPLQLSQIVFTELTSGSCTDAVEVTEQVSAEGTASTDTHQKAGDCNMENGEIARRDLGSIPPQGHLAVSGSEAWTQFVPSTIVLEEFMMIEAALTQPDHTQSQSPPLDEENSKAKEIPEEILENPTAEISMDCTEDASCIGDAEENVAFIITENQIQALSQREVQEIVSEKGEDIHTWSVSSANDKNSEDPSLDPSQAQVEEKASLASLDSKPVVVIFEEPMDIKTAYKRLSTVFEEYDEEFQTVLRGKDSSQETQTFSIPFEEQMASLMLNAVSEGVDEASKSESTDCTPVSESEGDLKHDNNTASEEKPLHSVPNVTSSEAEEWRNGNSKNVKIRFPKQRLNALTKAIESGSKTGWKTLQVVVYEEEEKIDKVTGEKQMEVKKYELNQIEQNKGRSSKTQNTSTAFARTEEIKNSTYKTMDSLEETIRELESTITQISRDPSSDFIFTRELLSGPSVSEPREQLMDESSMCPAAYQPDALEMEEDVPYLMDQPSSSTRSTSPSSRVKPPLLPKPQLPPAEVKVPVSYLYLANFAHCFLWASLSARSSPVVSWLFDTHNHPVHSESYHNPLLSFLKLSALPAKLG
ncbi:sickle tail protein homolog [Rhincodon typus]|uniref:sickle tail protein homolog n=1 Tax=Rhincodon typus TaxID=259920 RepID=UPI00202E852A|nr:sickle tail protein homolog [Rhincodon typus]